MSEQLFLAGLVTLLLFCVRVFITAYCNFISKYSTKYKVISYVWYVLVLVQGLFYWGFFTCLWDKGDHAIPVIVAVLVITFFLPIDIGFQCTFEDVIVRSINNYQQTTKKEQTMNKTININPSRLQMAMMRDKNNSRMTVEQKREVQTKFTSKIAEEAKYCEVAVFNYEMIEVVAKELIDCINEDNSKFVEVSFCKKLIENELMAKYLLNDAVRAVEKIVNVINGHDYRVINIGAVVNGVWKAFTPTSYVIQPAC